MVIVFCLCVLISSALSSAVPKLQNITIPVPDGTTNHGNPNLLCFPTKAWDIIVFILGNYAAHVATMITRPGELAFDSLFTRFLTLLLPFSGISIGVGYIYCAAYFQKTPLQVALKSLALCEVIRNEDWQPRDGDIVPNLKAPKEVKEFLSKELSQQTQYEERRQGGEDKLEGQQCQSMDLRAEIESSQWGSRMFQPNERWIHPFFKLNGEFIRGAFKRNENWVSYVFQHYQEWIHHTREPHRPARQVYGICKLPKGYSLTTFPTQSEVELCSSPGVPSSAVDSQNSSRMSKTRESSPGVGSSATDPPNTSPKSEFNEKDWELSCSYSIIKPLVAIIQLFYGCLTLYRARGDQVKQYGYSAFGLTVTPYVTMSFINLCGALLTPSYSHMYFVSTLVMEEAQKRRETDIKGVVGRVPTKSDRDEAESTEGQFTGIFKKVNDEGEFKLCLDIGKQKRRQNYVVIKFPNEEKKSTNDETPATHTSQSPPGSGSQIGTSSSPLILKIPARQPSEKSNNDKIRASILFLITIIIGCIPVAVVGGFSSFQPGNSSPFQRGWIMAWITAGVGAGLFNLQQVWTGSTWFKRYLILRSLLSLVACGMLAAGIGGFIVVGKMIREYGSCSLISQV